MIEIAIPGHRDLAIEHLVLDYNGTLACDGEILPGVRPALEALSHDVEIHVVTADTFGKAKARLDGYPCRLVVLPLEDQARAKEKYVQRLGAEHTAAVGNGRNDRLMLQRSTLGIAVILGEGAAAETVQAADVVCTDVAAALELLRHPLRLVATLRS